MAAKSKVTLEVVGWEYWACSDGKGKTLLKVPAGTAEYSVTKRVARSIAGAAAQRVSAVGALRVIKSDATYKGWVKGSVETDAQSLKVDAAVSKQRTWHAVELRKLAGVRDTKIGKAGLEKREAILTDPRVRPEQEEIEEGRVRAARDDYEAAAIALGGARDKRIDAAVKKAKGAK